MHREFRVVNSYTLECSFCGPTKGLHKDTHFSQKLLIVSRLLFHFYRKVVGSLGGLSVR